jgi:hypothetical protein
MKMVDRVDVGGDNNYNDEDEFGVEEFGEDPTSRSARTDTASVGHGGRVGGGLHDDNQNDDGWGGGWGDEDGTFDVDDGSDDAQARTRAKEDANAEEEEDHERARAIRILSRTESEIHHDANGMCLEDIDEFYLQKTERSGCNSSKERATKLKADGSKNEAEEKAEEEEKAKQEADKEEKVRQEAEVITDKIAVGPTDLVPDAKLDDSLVKASNFWSKLSVPATTTSTSDAQSSPAKVKPGRGEQTKTPAASPARGKTDGKRRRQRKTKGPR